MPSFAQGNSVSGSSVLAYPGAVSAGNTLICAIRVGAAITAISVSDDVNGAWTVTSTDFTGDTLIVAYFQNSATGTPTVTGSWTGGGSIRTIILDYTGVAAASVDQLQAADNGTPPVALPSTASVTTTVASEILIAIWEGSGGSAITSNGTGSNPSSGWTNRFAVDVGKLVADDVTVSSTGTYNEVWNNPSVDGGSSCIVTLKASGAAASPFIPLDFSKPTRVPRALFDLSVSLNPNLFKNPIPIMPTDRLPAFRVPLALPQPPVSLNLNLFKNPIPFNQIDWSKPYRVPSAPFDLSVPINPNLFKNPIPVLNLYDYLKPQAPIPTSWIPRFDALNINLFKNPFPFNQYDYLKPYFPVQRPDPQIGININLFTNPFPSNQYDWSKPFRVPLALPQPAIGINPNIFTNPYPFNQYDWSKQARVPKAPFDLSVALNPNIFTNPIPILNSDSTPSRFLPSSRLAEASYNQNLYTITVVASPFYQVDLFPIRRPPSAPVLDPTFNPNLFTNPIPILNLDSSGARFSRPVIDVPQPYNLNLYGIVTVSLPFNQYDLASIRKPLMRLTDDPQNFAVLVSVGPVAPPELHDLPFFANVGKLMGH